MARNIAVVGCGHWGKNLVRNFAELDSLLAVCDPDSEISGKFASQYSVEQMSFESLIIDDRVEGVVLAVPAPLHASMAVAAMNKGKSVFVEKPLAMNEAEARLMLDAGSSNNVQLMVGHLLQYHPVFLALKELCSSGSLGKLQYISSNRKSFGKVRSEEDVVWSFAPHDISMVLALIADEVSLVRRESSAILHPDISDVATLHLTFASGVKGHISVSWLHPYKEQKLVVIGSDGMAVFDDTKSWEEKLSLYRHRVDSENGLPALTKASVEYVVVPQSEPLRNECQHFIEVVAGRAMPLTDGEEGLRVLNVLNAASVSI